jgi:hypothetical protein
MSKASQELEELREVIRDYLRFSSAGVNPEQQEKRRKLAEMVTDVTSKGEKGL